MFGFKLVKRDVESSGYTAIDLTSLVEEVVDSCGLKEGIVTVYSPERHVIVTLIEYEPNLLKDLEDFMKKFTNRYEPVIEALLGKSVIVPVVDGSLDLGSFKNIVLVDVSYRSGIKRVYLGLEGIFS